MSMQAFAPFEVMRARSAAPSGGGGKRAARRSSALPGPPPGSHARIAAADLRPIPLPRISSEGGAQAWRC